MFKSSPYVFPRAYSVELVGGLSTVIVIWKGGRCAPNESKSLEEEEEEGEVGDMRSALAVAGQHTRLTDGGGREVRPQVPVWATPRCASPDEFVI